MEANICEVNMSEVNINPLQQLPDALPAPIDDGACNHLLGARLPTMTLHSTSGEAVDLSGFACVVIYCYPMTGKPDKPLPQNWDDIPGARGCTPQSCAFRDYYQAFSKLGAQVFGVSTQDSTYQKEAATRLHLPYSLLSDKNKALTNALALPTFSIDSNPLEQGLVLLKRATLIARYGVIEKVFYPVFPPQKNAEQVLAYLQNPNNHL